MKHIGIDLHTRQFQACWIEECGKSSQRGFPLTKFGLEAFVGTLDRSDKIAVESTGNTYFFKEMVKEHVADVVVVCTRQFKLIRKSMKKTDKNDAYMLAHFLKSEHLPESRLKSPLQQQVLRLCRLRDSQIGQRTKHFNCIHGIFNSRGVRLDKNGLSSAKKIRELDLSPFDENEVWEINCHRDGVFAINKQISRINAKIAELADQLEGFDVATSFKGVGLITGATVLAASGGPKNFKTKKQFSAFFGLVPRVDQSADTIHHGRITKRGNSLCRKTLIQSGQIARKYNDDLQGFFLRIAKTRGVKRANVAVARKLLDYIFDALRKDMRTKNASEFQAA